MSRLSKCENIDVMFTADDACSVIIPFHHRIPPDVTYRFVHNTGETKSETDFIREQSVKGLGQPKENHIRTSIDMLSKFYEKLDYVKNILSPILEKIAKNNNIIVMCLN